MSNLSLTNSCKFVGKISSNLMYTHDYNDSSYYAFTMDVPRKSGYVDNIHIFVSSKDLKQLPNSVLPVGSYCKVEGKLVNSKLKSHKDVSVLSTKFEILSEEPVEYINEVQLTGELIQSYVTKILDRIGKKVKTIIVKLPGEVDRVTLKISAWNKYADYLDSKFEVGDTVSVICRLEGKSRSSNPDILLHEGSLVTIVK